MFDAHKGWVRDSLLRGAGVLSLVCGGLLIRWLFNSADLRQHHDPSLIEFAAAALGFLFLSAGAVLTTLGEHIFDQVEISERWAKRAYDLREERHGSSPPAVLVVPDNDFITSISKAFFDDTSTKRRSGSWSIGGGHAAK